MAFVARGLDDERVTKITGIPNNTEKLKQLTVNGIFNFKDSFNFLPFSLGIHFKRLRKCFFDYDALLFIR